MKFYIAGKSATDTVTVHDLTHQLVSRGHQPLLNWYEADVKKPYSEHAEHNQPYAKAMMEAARDCELFILLWREGLEGGLWEVGAAASSTLTNFSKAVCVVGSNRPSVFHTLPQVKLFATTGDLLVFIDGLRQPRSK